MAMEYAIDDTKVRGEFKNLEPGTYEVRGDKLYQIVDGKTKADEAADKVTAALKRLLEPYVD